MSAPVETTEGRKPIMKTAGVVGLGIVACAACCAPLLSVPILGIIAGGGAGLVLAGQIGAGVVILAAIAALVVVQRRRSSIRRSAEAGCGCAPQNNSEGNTTFKLPQSRDGSIDDGPINGGAV